MIYLVLLLLVSPFLVTGFTTPTFTKRTQISRRVHGDYLTSLESPSTHGSDISINEASKYPETTSQSLPPKVHTLKSVDTFLSFIDDAPKDSLVVIKYFGESCPLCRKIEMKYKKMARFYAKAPIRFGEVGRRGAHKELFPTLGVNVYPHIQIYRNGQCVAAHGTESDVTFEAVVHDTIQRELAMTSEDWESFLTAFAEPIGQATQKLEDVRLLERN